MAARPDPRTLTRELRLTYGDQLPHGNRVIAGAFPAAPNVPNGLSLEEDYARDLGVKVGDAVTFDVQGVNVDMTVTSLRTIARMDWRTFVERQSEMEQVLRSESTGAYVRMTFQTRDHYRHVVERIAKRCGRGEADIARMAVSLATLRVLEALSLAAHMR